jgi:hypothetical protein
MTVTSHCRLGTFMALLCCIPLEKVNQEFILNWRSYFLMEIDVLSWKKDLEIILEHLYSTSVMDRVKSM